MMRWPSASRTAACLLNSIARNGVTAWVRSASLIRCKWRSWATSRDDATAPRSDSSVRRQGLVERCVERFWLVEHDEVPGIVDDDELVARNGGDEPLPGGDESVARDLALHVGDDEDDRHLDLAELGPEVGGEDEGDCIARG